MGGMMAVDGCCGSDSCGIFMMMEGIDQRGKVKKPNGCQNGQAQKEGDEHLLQIENRLEGANAQQQQKGAFKN
jgi:hypothetical protein